MATLPCNTSWLPYKNKKNLNSYNALKYYSIQDGTDWERFYAKFEQEYDSFDNKMLMF